ncbi:hypothetical protein DOE76_08290 [Leifsonia sp. ku-ls]|nr:hypothetical protein DOE76_08290 [Leifsonia sp. ku-ls]
MVDITPDIGYPMAGYGVDSPRISQGVNEPLTARCTVIWDSGTPNVIVTADVLAFGHTMHTDIRNRVVALGVASSDFVLTATHTHNGPVLIEKLTPFAAYTIDDQDPEIVAYSNWLDDAIVSLVQSTLAAPRTPCTLDYTVLDEDFSRNREGLSYVERDVPVLVARQNDGTPRAVLFGYGAHPVAANLQYTFDPDYPAEAIKRIEEVAGPTFAQFLTGPAGDQNPSDVSNGFAGSDGFGDDLGRTVANAIGAPGRPLTGPIGSVLSTVALPLDITDNPGNLTAVRNAYAYRASHPGYAGYYQRHAQQMMAQITAHTFATSVSLPIQRWSFGGSPGLDILFSGGEIVSGYAVYLRARHGGSQGLWVNGYSNEVPCYIPSDELLNHACYAGGWDTDFPGIAGGSMTVYGYLGHFRGKPTSTAPDGVEQILLSAIEGIL